MWTALRATPAGTSVALYGLSANPPTGEGGHATIVSHLRRQFDQVWVLPVYRHIFASKADTLAPYHRRKKMCQLAFDADDASDADADADADRGLSLDNDGGSGSDGGLSLGIGSDGGLSLANGSHPVASQPIGGGGNDDGHGGNDDADNAQNDDAADKDARVKRQDGNAGGKGSEGAGDVMRRVHYEQTVRGIGAGVGGRVHHGRGGGGRVFVLDVEREVVTEALERATREATPVEAVRVGSWDVLSALKAACPGVAFTWCLGGDTYSDLRSGKWRHGETFQEACAQLVVPRVGGAPAVGSLGPHARLANIDGMCADVSSTAVREALARRREQWREAEREGGRGRELRRGQESRQCNSGSRGADDGEFDGGSRGVGGNTGGADDGKEGALNALHPDVLRYIDRHGLFSVHTR